MINVNICVDLLRYTPALYDRSICVTVDNYTGIGHNSFDCVVDRDENIECLIVHARQNGCGGDSVTNAQFFSGESILSIDKSFRYYEIKDCDSIVMARDRNKKDERTFKLSVINDFTNKDCERFDIEVKRLDTVGQLKNAILSRLRLEEDVKYADLCYRGHLLFDDDKTIVDSGVIERDTVEILQRKLCLRPLNITWECEKCKCETIECRVDKVSVIDRAIEAILDRLNIDKQFKSSVKLYRNRNKTSHIKEDCEIFQCLNEDLSNRRRGCQIYYSIKSIVDNLYRNKELGGGAFGTVYLCTDGDSNTRKALKKFELNPNEQRSDFIREIEVYEKLGDHPRIIKYERHFEIETASFILMEYMPGGSLASHLRTNGPLSEGKISKYAKQICEGLKHLHDNKILHRDVKGENILIDSNDDIKLSDFGLSKILMGLPSRYFRNAAANTQVGTINYMAPEVINEDQFGSAADIWSFGATMVEMVTGHPPFHKKNDYDIITVIMNEKSIPFSYPLNSSDQIKSFINRCLQGDPLQRSTVNELLRHPFLS